MKAIAGTFCLGLLLASVACRSTRQDNQGDARAGQAPEPPVAGQEVTGTVRYLDLEGGFYGIEADDGAKLDPVNLPEEFQKDGLRVRARVETLEGRVSFHMWGRLVSILNIERL